MLTGLAIFIAVTIVMVLHAGLVAVFARMADVEVETVRIFQGPRLTRFPVGAVPVEIGAVPLGSYVQFEMDDDGKTGLDLASRPVRLGLALGPWLPVLLLSAVLVGPIRAVEAMLWGTVQFVGGGLLFWTWGTELVGQTADAFALPPTMLAGLVMAKLAGMNLTPAPGLSGGQAVEALLPWPLPPNVRMAGVLLLVFLALGWCAALMLWSI